MHLHTYMHILTSFFSRSKFLSASSFNCKAVLMHPCCWNGTSSPVCKGSWWLSHLPVYWKTTSLGRKSLAGTTPSPGHCVDAKRKTLFSNCSFQMWSCAGNADFISMSLLGDRVNLFLGTRCSANGPCTSRIKPFQLLSLGFVEVSHIRLASLHGPERLVNGPER